MNRLLQDWKQPETHCLTTSSATRVSFRGIVTRCNPSYDLPSVFHIIEFAPAIIFVATYSGSNHSLSILLCPYRDLWSSLLRTVCLPPEDGFMLFFRIPCMVCCLRFSCACRVSHDCFHRPGGKRSSILSVRER